MSNEKRLIDANALTDVVEHIDWYHISLRGTLAKGAISQLHTPLYKADDIYQAINDAPTVNAVEVVHGEWELHGNDDDLSGSYFCSKCGYNMDEAEYLDNFSSFRYCPYCGAKMDGGNEDGLHCT